MEEYLDFFNIYIMGVIEMSFQFYFLIKILNKKLWPPLYFLFAVCAVLIDHFLSAGTIIRFMVLVFLLTACGTFRWLWPAFAIIWCTAIFPTISQRKCSRCFWFSSRS